MTADTRILGTPVSVGAIAASSISAPDLPDTIEGYSVLKEIGRGGMGSVFEVCHKALGKRFALKLLSESLRDNPEAINRFRSETLALGKLEHPNIVSAIDAGVWQGRPFLVTELLKGCDLACRVTKAGKLDSETVISIAAQLASALDTAHQHGYFHRDIKPSNIFYQPDGSAKLLDFGLVRSACNQPLTQAGCFMGTVDFVAPEQAGNAGQAAAASDIYSFGCTLIFLLSGDVPFPSSRYPTLTAKIAAHMQETPDWLANDRTGDQPSWLVELIRSMVAKRPYERPETCQLIHQLLLARGSYDHKSAESETSRRTFFTGKKLAVSSGVAVAVAAGCWSIAGPQQQDPSIRTPPSSSRSTSSSLTISTEAQSSPEVKSPARDMKENRLAEKTLPVSTTNNARGARLSSKRISSITPVENPKKELRNE